MSGELLKRVQSAGISTVVATGTETAGMVEHDAYARRILANATPRYFRKRMIGGKRYLVAVIAGGVLWGLWMGLFLGFAPVLIATSAFYALFMGLYFLTMTSMRLLVSDRAIHRQQVYLREIPLESIEDLRVVPQRFHLNWVGWYEKGTGRSVIVRYRGRSGRSRVARFDVDDAERFIAAIRGGSGD